MPPVKSAVVGGDRRAVRAEDAGGGGEGLEFLIHGGSGRWLWYEIEKGGWVRSTAELYSERRTPVERGNRHVEELRVTHGNTCCWFFIRAQCWSVWNKCASIIVNFQMRKCLSDNISLHVSFGWTGGQLGQCSVTAKVRFVK